MNRVVSWIVMISFLGVIACGRESVVEPAADVPVDPPVASEAAPARAKAESTVVAYDCDGGAYVVAEFRAGKDDLVLFLPGETVFLPHVPSGSGARYADDGVSFWSKGHEALLERDGVTVHCVKNGPASVIERAKLGGADFWATGNEPGWTLELFSDHLILVTNYGETRIEAPIGKPVEDPTARTAVFSATGGEHEITVTLHGARCSDDMSGQQFETTVELVLDGRTYRGCGQALH